MSRRLEALRNLAERPGTPAEGEVARRLYECEKSKQGRKPSSLDEKFGKFAAFMRSGSMDDLRDAVGPSVCPCGAEYPAFGRCENTKRHEQIKQEIRTKFPRGMRVYYNYWAYDRNCAATVSGYTKDQRCWNWINVKFDHLKSGYRSIPVYSKKGWHLSARSR